MNRYIFIFFILFSFYEGNQFINGIDISMLKQVEENGGKFYENGIQIDPIQTFKYNGVNTARIKIWHTPTQNYNNLESVLEVAHRASNAGLDLILDFHYSDTWADPSKQTKPSAWVDLNFDTLCDSVEKYSHHVMTKLKNQNTLPKYVQIGNETDCGLLWPDGYVCDESNNNSQWNKLGELFLHAIKGVKSALDNQDTLGIISHVSSGGNWFFKNLIERGVNVDILGISYYPMWHGNLTDLNKNLNKLGNEFQKPILIIETAYPFTLESNDDTNNIVGLETQLLENYQASEQGQFSFLNDLITLVNNSDYGLGVCYWAPDWISTRQFGSPWENQTLFNFHGELLNTISAFTNSLRSKESNSEIIPNSFELYQNFPNPFNPITTIKFNMPKSEFINLTIYNIKGQKIRNLINEFKNFGDHKISWDGKNNFGESVPTGIYFYKINNSNQIVIKKMMLIK